MILLIKCIRSIGPKYIRDFFSIRETSYNLRGNGVNLCVPKFNLLTLLLTSALNCKINFQKMSSWPIMHEHDLIYSHMSKQKLLNQQQYKI